MSTEHIAGQQGLPSGIPGDTALLLVGIGPLVYDLLDFHEQLRRDDLQFRDNIGMICTAPQDTNIHDISEDVADTGGMPILSGAVFDSHLVQKVCNALRSPPFCRAFLVDEDDNSCFLFIDCQVEEFVAFLVDSSKPDQLVTIGTNPARKVSVFRDLPQTGRGSDRGLFAFTIGRPKADIIHQAVIVGVKPLFALFHAPNVEIRPIRSNMNTNRISNSSFSARALMT